MRNTFNFESEPFEFYSEFDEFEEGQSAKPCQCHKRWRNSAEFSEEYQEEQPDTYSEFGEEYESDFEGETFETYPEFEDAYEMEKDPAPVDIGGGDIICGVVYRDLSVWGDRLSDLWAELRREDLTLGSDKKIKEARALISERDKKIKKARAAHFGAAKTIVTRLDNGWYASKGCKEVDFNYIIRRAVMTDKELKEDEGVQKISKWLSDHAKEALKKAQKASQKRRPVRGRR